MQNSLNKSGFDIWIVPLQLLKRNPIKRLGAGERDANELKGEKFYEVIHFPHF